MSRNPKLYIHNGESKSVREWAELAGVSPDAMRYRLKVMTVEDALNVVPRKPFVQRTDKPGECLSPLPEKFAYAGQEYTIDGWANLTGINNQVIRQRIKVLKWPLGQALGFEPRPPKIYRTLTAKTPDGPVTKSMSAWSKERRISMSTIGRRLGLGWSETQALGFEPGPMEQMIQEARARKNRKSYG